MEVTTLLQTSCVLFLLAALGGLAMAGIRFGGNRNPPVWLAMAHGGLAVAGVALLAWAVLALSAPATAAWSLLLFLVAAGGGTILFLAYEWERRLLPSWLVVVHGIVAVIAFVLLALAALAPVA
ncbi:hypothetical protein QAA18_09460 [Luteimonas sp. 8-5]|uniref:hypothetical protein n=1 Tax=Luteimonas sp. 8-5 TaxID=3039387 RepID=UPI0024373381|nr:hypothetical protein [Luteimonas sp. 8-5]MDG6348961.1 hypothetical protein [Luteimonas sp. 8-5]